MEGVVVDVVRDLLLIQHGIHGCGGVVGGCVEDVHVDGVGKNGVEWGWVCEDRWILLLVKWVERGESGCLCGECWGRLGRWCWVLDVGVGVGCVGGCEILDGVHEISWELE